MDERSYRFGTAVPGHDVHEAFVRFARTLFRDRRSRAFFERMTKRSQIAHRWSCLAPAEDWAPAGEGNVSIDAGGSYVPGGFPSTAERMRRYELEAPALAAEAVSRPGRACGRPPSHISSSAPGFPRQVSISSWWNGAASTSRSNAP